MSFGMFYNFFDTFLTNEKKKQHCNRLRGDTDQRHCDQKLVPVYNYIKTNDLNKNRIIYVIIYKVTLKLYWHRHLQYEISF